MKVRMRASIDLSVSVDFGTRYAGDDEVRGYRWVCTLFAIGDVFQQSVRLEF